MIKCGQTFLRVYPIRAVSQDGCHGGEIGKVEKESPNHVLVIVFEKVQDGDACGTDGQRTGQFEEA